MPKLNDNQQVLFTRQRHEADRAGLHFDYRMVIGDKAHSWATKKDLPAPGNSIILWGQPVHTAHYALSERVEIPKGQYGAGVTTLDFVQKGKISHPDETGEKFSLHLNDGKRFLFRKLPETYGKGAWLFKHLIPAEEPNKYLEKIALLLTLHQHDETGRTIWVKDNEPGPGKGWTKTNKTTYIKKKKVPRV